MKRVLPIILIAACASEPTDQQQQTRVYAGQVVQVTRDARGIPHIEARTMRAAMYAVGYAQAQDRLAQMHVARMIMRGRSAEILAVAYDQSCHGCDNTEEGCSDRCVDENKKRTFTRNLIASDREIRSMGYLKRARRIWPYLPDDSPALLLAYAAGVNQYLADMTRLDTGLVRLGLSREDIFPWTPEDSILAWARIGRFAGAPVGQAVSEIKNLLDCRAGSCPQRFSYCETPPNIDEAAAVVPPPQDGIWPPSYPGEQSSASNTTKLPQSLPQGGDRHPPVTKTASHGWVVHGSKTDTGKPILVGDPKLTLKAPSHFYQFHIKVAPEDVNAQVISFPGAGGAMAMGWNKYISHTVTAGGGDVTDTFILTPGEAANTYIVDGQQRRLVTRTETILVRQGSPVTLTVRESDFGPILSRAMAPSVGSFLDQNLVAVRHAPLAKTDTDSIVSGYKMLRARNLWEYRDAIRHWMVPTVNALYGGVDQGADANDPGHIAFHSLYAMPVRTPITAYGRDFTGRFPLDGSVSANDWSGYYDLNWHPHVIDPTQGYLFSGNHLPVGTWHHDTVYSGLSGTGDGYRSLRVRYLLAELARNNGGVLPARDVHLAHYDARSTATDIVHRALTLFADRGAISRPTMFDHAPQSLEQRAGYVLLVLDLWAARGGRLERSNKYALMTGRIMKALKDGFRYKNQNSPELNRRMICAWGNHLRFLKAFDRDASVLGQIEVQYILTAAAEAYSRTFETDTDLPADPNAWPEQPLLDTFARYMSDFFCASYDTCSLDPAHNVPYQLDRSWLETLSDPKGASWPFTANFAAINESRALLAPGVSGDPQRAHFDDTISLIEAASRGVDAIPLAPLDTALVTPESVVQIVVPGS